MPRKTAFGRWLYEARTARGWNMRDAGDAAGLSHVRISQIERGESGEIPRETVKKIARALYLGETEDGYAQFEVTALESAGFVADTDGASKIRQDKNTLWEAYWNLPARDKSIVDHILYTNMITGEVMTMDDINKILEDDDK